MSTLVAFPVNGIYTRPESDRESNPGTQSMPIVTVSSALNLLSLAAFFVSLSLQFLAAIFPGYWAMRAP